MVRRWVAILALGLVFAGTARACLWDFDTLAMERQRFPAVAELIAGKFLRHSPAYYEWRVGDRQAKLTALGPAAPLEKVLPLRDDLAVAYDKLGQHAEAIAAGEATLALEPGRYESVANLGTFYIHNGELERGLALIKQAIGINPDAHFGREKYQQYLVEYVLFRRAEGDGSLPLRRVEGESPIATFAEFVALRDSGWDPEIGPIDERLRGARFWGEPQAAAIQGVLGMMRFGNYQSPILLEALGDVLNSGLRPPKAYERLAARAYIRAAELSPEPEDSFNTYFVQWPPQVADAYSLDAELVRERLAAEIQDAEAWHQGVVEDEHRWIREGGDVDAAFGAKYYHDPELSQPWRDWLWDRYLRHTYRGGVLRDATVILLIFVVGFFLKFLFRAWRYRRDRRAAAARTEEKLREIERELHR